MLELDHDDNHKMYNFTSILLQSIRGGPLVVPHHLYEATTNNMTKLVYTFASVYLLYIYIYVQTLIYIL